MQGALSGDSLEQTRRKGGNRGPGRGMAGAKALVFKASLVRAEEGGWGAGSEVTWGLRAGQGETIGARQWGEADSADRRAGAGVGRCQLCGRVGFSEERQATGKETKERKEFTLQVWNQRGEGICRGSGRR